MSVQIKTVEFERRDVHLSELESGPPYTVHGIALGAGDVTTGRSGITKYWPAEELQKAAESLRGTSLVEDHDNSSRGVVGRVTKAGFKEGVGVIYEAELFDEELADRIENGLLEVSIRGRHTDVDTMEETEEGAKIVEGIEFKNLSIVPKGASPSNTLEMGEHDELSLAELAAFTDDLEAEELQEIEPGMWVTTGDTHGITVSPIEDGEIEVDIYEEMDDKWRSTGETEMYEVGSLEEWEVDDEDIGAMKKEESDDSDEEEEAASVPEEYFFDSEESAMDFIEDKEGLTGVHEMDDGWMPGADHDEFMEWWDNQSSQSGHMDEEDEDDEEEENAVRSSDNPSDDSSKANDDDQTSDNSPSVQEGQMVQWQVNPNMFGKVVHIDDEDEMKVMVEVMRMRDGEMVSTGHTVSAGFSDVVPADTEEMSDRQEGEEKPLNSKQDLKKMRKNGNRYTPDELDEEELQEYSRHEVSWDGTTESDWSSPDMEDFDTDDLSEIASHFIISSSGFPPENFGDLKLPVVEPNGDLNLNALAAVKGGRGVSAVDGLSSEMEDEIVNYVNNLANEYFDKNWGEEEATDDESDSDDSGRPTATKTVGGVSVLTGDDLWHRDDKSKESELDETTITTNMTEDIEEKLAELSEPVAVEQTDLEELQRKADRFDEMSETLDDLKERTDILDSVDREQVEELANSEEPVVVESTRYEALEQEAEQVKTVYAAALSEEMPAFSAEELAERFSIEELRAKYEEQIGDPEEELAADPRSGDPEEEELEERAEEQEEEELSEEEETVAQKQAELREALRNGR